jgi:carbamoyl-phosphate synthase large subunit
LPKKLHVVGLMNMQYAFAEDMVYVLEANPRASRTVLLVSKVCNISMVSIATELMMDKKLNDMKLAEKKIPYFGVKDSVFPFNMFSEVDPILDPEMWSTDEVLGRTNSFGMVFYKTEEADKQTLPENGTVSITVSGKDQQGVLNVARELPQLGFEIMDTKGTHEFLAENGVKTDPILKLHEGRPNIDDAIKNGQIQLVISTPIGKDSQYDDSYIRKAAIKYKVPYITTIAAASAVAKGNCRFSKESIVGKIASGVPSRYQVKWD